MMSKLMPWETPLGKSIWRNQVAFMTFLRGGLRRGLWNQHPFKLELLKAKRYKIDNPSPKGKREIWGFDCELCHGTFPIKEGQVDHINPTGTLTQISDIQGFVERLVVLTEDDLRLVCKNCNSIHAYADKHKISFEDARIEKEAIEICKGDDKKWLLAHNITPASNTKLRREQVVQVLREVNNDK